MVAQKSASKANQSKAKPTRPRSPKKARAKTSKHAVAAAELPVLSFKGPAELERWLSSHHAKSRGIWLCLMKKASGVASVNYQEALAVAIAWGWIDGQLKPHDAHSL